MAETEPEEQQAVSIGNLMAENARLAAALASAQAQLNESRLAQRRVKLTKLDPESPDPYRRPAFTTRR